MFRKLCWLVFLIVSVSAYGQVDFSSGFERAAGVTLNSSAQIVGKSVRILDNTINYQEGSFFWNSPVSITRFTTSFDFQFTNAMADGMTFTFQELGPTALGGSAGGLGYQGMAGKSVAVKFDIYDNAGEGTDSTGLYENGVAPNVPSDDITGSGVVLNSGDPMHVVLTYDGKNLSMVLTDQTTKLVYTQSFAVDLAAVLGTNTAYVGFTGSDGGEKSTLDILDWNFSSDAGVSHLYSLSGHIASVGNAPFNGKLTVQLASAVAQNGCGSSSRVVSNQTTILPVVNGIVSGGQFVSNDCLKPNVPYWVKLYDNTGNLAYSDNWYIPQVSGNTIDVGQFSSVHFSGPIVVAVPYAVVQQPYGNQTVVQPNGTALSVNNLNVTGIFNCTGTGCSGGGTGGGGGGATFPTSDGVVWNTSTTSSVNATSSQIVSALNLSPSTQLDPSLIPQLNQDTTGNSGSTNSFFYSPSTCGYGVAATGIDAHGNALGCFTPSGGSGGTTTSGSAGIPDISLTIPAMNIPAQTCWGPGSNSTPGTFIMTGLGPGTSVGARDTGNPTNITGYGSVGGLDIRAWVSGTNQGSYVVCNPTGASVPAAAYTVDMSASAGKATTGGGGGAVFPSTPGVVYSTSSTSSATATSSEIATALNNGPTTQLSTTLIPTLNQNTTGNAATANAFTYTPSTCGSGVAATGVDANGNALGCFTPAGGTSTGASLSQTSEQSFAGAISAPQINKVFQLDNFIQLHPNGCTVGGTAYTTPLECAWYTATTWVTSNSASATLYLGSGSFNTVGQLTIPNTGFEGTLSVQGDGPQATQINLTGTVSSGGVIDHPSGSLNRFHIRGLRVNAKHNAPYAINLASAIYTDISDVIASGANIADIEVPTGTNTSALYNVFSVQDGSVSQGKGAQFTPTITNGTLTGLALASGNTGGSGYTPANTHINFYGTGSSVPDQPCTTLPTATATFNGSTITGATITSAGSGCTGTMYVSVFDGSSTQYGIDIGAYDMTVYGGGAEEGITAGLHITGDSVKTYSFHPYYLPTLIWVDGAGGAKFYGTECDSPRHYCIEQSFYTEQYGTSLGWDGNGPYPGSSFMHITNSNGRNFEATMTCANVQAGGGFNDFVDSGLGVLTAHDPNLKLWSNFMAECSPGNPVGTQAYENTVYMTRPKYVDSGTKNVVTLQAPVGAVTGNVTEQLPQSGNIMGAASTSTGGTCTSTGYIPVNINGTTIHMATCQ